MSSVIQKNKKRAASIQEKIDIGLFGIPENKMINPDFIDYDIVRRYSKKNRKDKDKLRKVTNWYSEKIYELHTNIAILFCQRMNICYDQNIKHRYNNLLLILSGFTFAVLLTLSIINDFSIINFIIQVLLPLIPIANFTYSEIARNKEAVDNLQNLREIIEEEIDAVSINDSISATKLRNIQDQIYNNRVLSPLIPDCIYNHLWTSSEDEMNYSVQARIEELINNSNKDPDIK